MIDKILSRNPHDLKNGPSILHGDRRLCKSYFQSLSEFRGCGEFNRLSFCRAYTANPSSRASPLIVCLNSLLSTSPRSQPRSSSWRSRKGSRSWLSCKIRPQGHHEPIYEDGPNTDERANRRSQQVVIKRFLSDGWRPTAEIFKKRYKSRVSGGPRRTALIH